MPIARDLAISCQHRKGGENSLELGKVCHVTARLHDGILEAAEHSISGANFGLYRECQQTAIGRGGIRFVDAATQSGGAISVPPSFYEAIKTPSTKLLYGDAELVPTHIA